MSDQATTTVTGPRPSTAARPTTRGRRLSPRTRRATLVVHIISSVALLGASASVLMLAITAGSTDDEQLATAAYRFASKSGLVFGIPLSFTALFSGLTLALGGRWGLLRHRWVTIKLVLLIGTIFSGALLIGPNADHLRDGGEGGETQLIIGAIYNVVALAVATGLSIYRPSKFRRAK